MQKYISVLRCLIQHGYTRDKALLAVARAFALTPDEIVRLHHAV